MIIAIDYDGTYTADPHLWNGFMQAAVDAGHRIICVTMRRPDEPAAIPCEVIYTARRAKVRFMEEIGQKVDVWIDDAPHWLLSDG